MEKATFAAGCFWGIEAHFQQLPGVLSTRVGYTGGWEDNPSYQSVCQDNTGHAESVEIEFDPATISYDELLNHFWKIHDPTTLDRQGPDVGTQYRSVIFFHSPEQQAAALDSKENLMLAKKFKTPIVTQIVPAAMFYPAEEYHQRYLEKQGIKHCHISDKHNE
jgi:peptide-methionine (S)-S-oxide reductase